MDLLSGLFSRRPGINALLLTKAICLPSGDQMGTFRLPWPPYR